jgi:flagellar export protein FliJ
MSFPPSLERLLSLRQSLERQEEMRLAVINGERENVRAALAALQLQMRQLGAGALAQAGEVSGAELQSAACRQMSLAEIERQLQLRADELERAHRAQCQRLAERQQARKILEALRDRRLAFERVDERRREQARLDEIFLLRR